MIELFYTIKANVGNVISDEGEIFRNYANTAITKWQATH